MIDRINSKNDSEKIMFNKSSILELNKQKEIVKKAQIKALKRGL